MSIALRDIQRCFEGEIPAMLATSSGDGVPNLGHLSQVILVDDDHVAISNQFLTKTRANLAENPHATVVCVEPVTLLSYKLLVRYEGSEDAGPTFDSVRQSLDTIASMTGMADVFGLRSVELFRVLHVELVPSRGTVALA